MVARFTPLQPTVGIAHVDLRLVCGCLDIGPISWSSWQAVWNSVVSVATEDRLFLRTTRFSTLSVCLCGLPLRCWAAVAPGHFHFKITAQQGRNLNWLVGKVASYDGATLKVNELFSKAILLPMFVYGGCMDVCSFLYTCHQWVRLGEVDHTECFLVLNRCTMKQKYCIHLTPMVMEDKKYNRTIWHTLYIHKSMWTPLHISGFVYFSHTHCWQVYKIEQDGADKDGSLASSP
jgi:hypothetical protein